MAETAQKADQPLDDLMMAMDVVDTLRHRELIVERELGSDTREENLVARLREIYKNQGIEVSDAVLAEGVKALAEDRFVYRPPSVGFSRTLARIYISRMVWGKWAAGALIALVLIIGGWYVAIERPRQIAAAEARQELTVTLPKSIAETKAAILAEAKEAAAKTRAESLAQAGTDAIAAGNLVAARKAETGLTDLLSELRRTYKIRIVSRPGTPSGASRIPDANRQARNYYVIVEAIDPNGQTLSLPITSEEDGTTKTVSIWGVRVSAKVYNDIRRDKAADGIVDNADIGVKQRGYLTPQWTIPVEDGRITQW